MAGIGRGVGGLTGAGAAVGGLLGRVADLLPSLRPTKPLTATPPASSLPGSAPLLGRADVDALTSGVEATPLGLAVRAGAALPAGASGALAAVRTRAAAVGTRVSAAVPDADADALADAASRGDSAAISGRVSGAMAGADVDADAAAAALRKSMTEAGMPVARADELAAGARSAVRSGAAMGIVDATERAARRRGMAGLFDAANRSTTVRLLVLATLGAGAVAALTTSSANDDDPACRDKVFDLTCAVTGAAKTAGKGAAATVETVAGDVLPALWSGLTSSPLLVIGALLVVAFMVAR